MTDKPQSGDTMIDGMFLTSHRVPCSVKRAIVILEISVFLFAILFHRAGAQEVPWFSSLDSSFILPADVVEYEPIRVTHIYFDHDNSEAVYLRENYTTPIPKPEWVMGERSGAALYVQNKPVEIMARFEAYPGVDSAYIWAEGDSVLGGTEGRWVHFTNRVSDPEYYSFMTDYPAPSGLGHYRWHWRWKTSPSFGNVVMDLNVSGPHEIYTILKNPGLPWEIDEENNQNPWTDALDLLIHDVEASSVEEVLDEITVMTFDRPCFEYDIWNGAPCYIQGYWNFNLTLFISDMVNQHEPRVGNCYDGAAIVHTLSDLLGAHTYFVYSNPFGYLNCIDPIGREEDYANNPFHEGFFWRDDPVVYQDGTMSSCGRSSFGNHAFAATRPGADGVIWDATMCVDIDGNPDTSVKFPPDGGYTSTHLTNTTLTDATQSWIANEWVGMLLNPNTNENSPDPYKEYRITGNTGTVITVEAGSNMTQFAGPGDNYWIRDPEYPEVDIIRLTGIEWPDYNDMTVDGGSAAVPYSISITLR